MENNYFLSSLIYISGFEKSFRKALCAEKGRVYGPFPVGKRVSVEGRVFYISYEGETFKSSQDGIAVYHYQESLRR
jgi:hypothetical protein